MTWTSVTPLSSISAMTPTGKTGNEKPPADRLGLTYLNLVYQGLSISFPWHVLISGQNYFEHRLRHLPMASDFLVHFAMIFMTIKFIFLISAVYFVKKVKPTWQVNLATIGQIFVFGIIISSTVATWLPLKTYYIILLTMVLFASVFSAFAEAGFFAIIGAFPPKYIQAFVFGHGIAGVVVVSFNIVSFLITRDASNGKFALLFFGLGLAAMVLSFVFTQIQARSAFYQHYLRLGSDIITRKESASVSVGSRQSSYWSLFQKTWDLIAALFVDVVVGLILFPNLVLMTKSTHMSQADTSVSLYGSIFTQTALLIMSVAGLLGKLLPSIEFFAIRQAPFLFLASLRLIFVPLVLLGNIVIPERTVIYERILASDVLYFIVISFIGFTGGYLGTLCMMWAPSRVKAQDRAKAATLIIFALAVGLLVGSYLSLLVRYLFVRLATLPVQLKL